MALRAVSRKLLASEVWKRGGLCVSCYWRKSGNAMGCVCRVTGGSLETRWAVCVVLLAEAELNVCKENSIFEMIQTFGTKLVMLSCFVSHCIFL